MGKQCVNAPSGPPAQGPYSHAVIAGNVVYVSGQGPFEPDGSGVRRGTLEEEALLALSNLKAVLEDAGSGIEYVVKVTVFLADMGTFAAFNSVYKQFFTGNYPARTCLQAGRLPLDIQVELDAVAVLREP